jgi:periplasmic divalent cation tolerance protein
VSPSRFASDSGVRVILVTAPEPDTAARLARTLVEERLAACVNLVPQVRSIYRWQDQVQDDSETLLVIKTRAERCDALASRVEELHPYDVPEVVELSVAGGSDKYLRWVVKESAP